MKNETLPRLCKIKLQRVFAKPALSHKGVNQITAKTYTQKERKNWDTSKNEWWKNHNPIVNWLYVKKGYTYLLIPIDWILFIHPSPEYKKSMAIYLQCKIFAELFSLLPIVY